MRRKPKPQDADINRWEIIILETDTYKTTAYG